jgi:hypothetical protein
MGSVLSTVASWVAKGLYYALHPVWLQLWPPIQLVYLICKRNVLREENLNVPVTLPPSTSVIREGDTPANVRTFEGSGNNRSIPTMGMTGCPFARNCLPPLPEADVSQGPDPVMVSQKLLARPNGVTKTRPLANLLAGATEICLSTGHYETLQLLGLHPPLTCSKTVPHPAMNTRAQCCNSSN